MSGTVDVLLELRERIASQVELRAEERSKFARGLALFAGKIRTGTMAELIHYLHQQKEDNLSVVNHYGYEQAEEGVPFS